MIMIRFAIATALLLFVAACGRIEASRDFNFGVRYFNDEKFDAAVRSFEKASESFTDPAISYNLALSHMAALRELSNDGEKANLKPEQIAAGLAAVASAQGLPEPTDEMLAKLGYIEGTIYALAGNSEAARKSFQKSLSADSKFAPTLKARLELDAEAFDALSWRDFGKGVQLAKLAREGQAGLVLYKIEVAARPRLHLVEHDVVFERVGTDDVIVVGVPIAPDQSYGLVLRTGDRLCRHLEL